MASISVLLGCASSNSHGSASDAGSTCGHAPGVASFDAGSTTACAGAAGVALCMYAGLNEECITDDLTTCPDADAIFEGGPYTCTDLCAANEYAVSCGPLTAPPSGCHLFDGGMILVGVECCPCL